MVSQLTTEAIVFSEPVMKVAPNTMEYLEMKIGLFNIKEHGSQEFTYVDCTLWSNPNLAKQIMEMNLQPSDRILVSGKFTLKKLHGKLKLRIYIHDLTLLKRNTVAYKNVEYEAEDIDFSIISNSVEEINTEPVKIINKQNVLDNDKYELKNEEW